MKKIYLLLPFVVFSFSGCLIFNKMSYNIKIEGKGGTAEIIIYDIRSDAENPQDFDQDKDNLFNYMWKSQQFIDDMKKEGKQILDRKLYVSNDTLIGKVTVKFNNISNLDSSIVFEDNFYYMTLPLEDSVVTTNGEIIESKLFKRILWDSSFDVLKFEMFSASFENKRYRPLAFYFKSQK